MPSSASSDTLALHSFPHDALPIYARKSRSRRRHVFGRRDPAPARGRRRRRSSPELRPGCWSGRPGAGVSRHRKRAQPAWSQRSTSRSEAHTSELQSRFEVVCRLLPPATPSLYTLSLTTLFRSMLENRGPADGTFSAVETPRRPGAGGGDDRHPNSGPGAGAAGRAPACPVTGSGLSRPGRNAVLQDRKRTRLNSSHVSRSYAVFCLQRHPRSTLFPSRRSSDLCSKIEVPPTARFRPSRPRAGQGPEEATIVTRTQARVLERPAGRRRVPSPEAGSAGLVATQYFKIGSAHV